MTAERIISHCHKKQCRPFILDCNLVASHNNLRNITKITLWSKTRNRNYLTTYHMMKGRRKRKKSQLKHAIHKHFPTCNWKVNKQTNNLYDDNGLILHILAASGIKEWVVQWLDWNNDESNVAVWLVLVEEQEDGCFKSSHQIWFFFLDSPLILLWLPSLISCCFPGVDLRCQVKFIWKWQNPVPGTFEAQSSRKESLAYRVINVFSLAEVTLEALPW